MLPQKTDMLPQKNIFPRIWNKHIDAAILQQASAPTLYVDMPQPLLCTRLFPKVSEELSYEMFIIINIFPYA